MLCREVLGMSVHLSLVTRCPSPQFITLPTSNLRLYVKPNVPSYPGVMVSSVFLELGFCTVLYTFGRVCLLETLSQHIFLRYGLSLFQSTRELTDIGVVLKAHVWVCVCELCNTSFCGSHNTITKPALL